MKTLINKSIILLFIVSATPCFASDEGEHDKPKVVAKSGAEVSKQCVSCHGEDGNSIAPNFPKLSGQHADYMFHALKSYKNGDRKNAIMAGIVAALSEKEMKNVANYYANLNGELTVVNIDDESMH